MDEQPDDFGVRAPKPAGRERAEATRFTVPIDLIHRARLT
jgi:hypothetical protein